MRRRRAAAASGTSASTPRRPASGRRPGLRRSRRLPVRRAGPGPCRARRRPGPRRRRPGRRADRAGPGLPVRGRAGAPRLPRPRRPRRGSWRLGAAPAQGRRPRARRRAPQLMAGLTVAVTGPTGEIGKAFIRALERSREVGRIVGMARRPFDPAAHGWKRPSTAAATCSTARRSRGWSRAPTSSCTSRSSSSRPAARRATSTSRGRATSSRRPSRPAPSGWSTLELGRGLRLPGGLDGRITEDEPALGNARHPYSAQKAEVEEVLADALERRRDRGLGLPARASSPAPRRPLLDQIPGALAATAARPLALAGRRRAAVLPDPGVPFQLVHHDDVATALRAGVARSRRARGLQPRRPGRVTMGDLAAAHGLPQRADAELAVERGGRGRRPPAVPARGGLVDRGAAPPGDDGHGQGAAPAELAPAPRRAGDPAPDGQRAISVTGTPKRRWASPSTSSSR